MKHNHQSYIAITLFSLLLLVNQAALAVGKSLQDLMPSTTTVTTVAAKEITWRESVQSVGSLSAFKGATITAQANGPVTEIYFKSGDEVKKGQKLVQIYPDILQAQIAQAKANEALNKATYERDKKLVAKGFVTAEALDTAKANYEFSAAQVRQYEAQLSQYVITAPFSGRIGLNQVSIGSYLTVGTPIVDLQDINSLRVDFSLPETYLNQVKVGESVSLTSNAYPDKSFQGNVYAIDSSIDTDTRMISVRAKIDNDKHQLLPGAYVEVTLYLTNSKQVIVIPATAVQYSPEGAYVYLLSKDKKKAIKTPVSLGEQLDNNQIIITKGLKPGDPIITGGQMKLMYSDYNVKVADNKTAGNPPTSK
ncbi:MAG: efflux RND transporter periplasmic adaptor subunit [Pseudomonadota bacterium]